MMQVMKTINLNNKRNSNENLNLRRSNRLKTVDRISYEETDTTLDKHLLSSQSIVCKLPSSFQEIYERDDENLWLKAINEELFALIENNTWTIVDKPSDKNIIGCKWIFSLKNDEYGNPVKRKARLVAQGFSQRYLIDYNETFAPVARISSFRFIIAFSLQHDLLIHQMDVKTAFLNGNLKEEIYMKLPEGIDRKEIYMRVP